MSAIEHGDNIFQQVTNRFPLPPLSKPGSGGVPGGPSAPPNWPDIAVQAVVLDATLLPAPTAIGHGVESMLKGKLPAWLPTPDVLVDILGTVPAELRIGLWFPGVASEPASLAEIPALGGLPSACRCIVTQGFLERALLWFLPNLGELYDGGVSLETPSTVVTQVQGSHPVPKYLPDPYDRVVYTATVTDYLSVAIAAPEPAASVRYVPIGPIAVQSSEPKIDTDGDIYGAALVAIANFFHMLAFPLQGGVGAMLAPLFPAGFPLGSGEISLTYNPSQLTTDGWDLFVGGSYFYSPTRSPWVKVIGHDTYAAVTVEGVPRAPSNPNGYGVHTHSVWPPFSITWSVDGVVQQTMSVDGTWENSSGPLIYTGFETRGGTPSHPLMHSISVDIVESWTGNHYRDSLQVSAWAVDLPPPTK